MSTVTYSTSAFDRLLRRLTDVTGHPPRGYGDRAMARCPAHRDGSPSLSIRRAGDRVLAHCHAGCELADVLAAVGLGMGDLFDAPRQPGWRPPHLPPRPPPAPADPGWAHVSEGPDVPDVTRRATYAASTAHVPPGTFPGAAVVRRDPYLTTFEHRHESQTGRAFPYRPRPGQPIRWAERRGYLRCERCGTLGADCSWSLDMTRKGGGDCCERCRHPSQLMLAEPIPWEGEPW